jgi:hypothetical protein
VGGSGSTVSTGSATLTYDATQTLRSMSLSVSNVHLPDGMIMHCMITDNGLTQPTSYYPIDVPQLVCASGGPRPPRRRASGPRPLW